MMNSPQAISCFPNAL